ncbi:MAG: FimV/HubP family polar landmark protein [Lysobacteraceae bacterium]
MNRKLRLPLAMALAFGSSHALALGLGQIEVKSALYQPLDAQIPVHSTTPNEAANLKVRLASAEDFARVGLDSSSMLSANLEFSVKKDASGKPVIHVTTDGKLNDPFVSFLLEVDWGKGRLLREFTVLLDPPLTAPVTGSTAPARVPSATEPLAREPMASEPVAAETMPAPEPEPVASMPTPEPAPSSPPPSIPAQTAPAPEPEPAATPDPTPVEPTPVTPAPVAAPAPSGEYGPTISGDTLWSIATRVRPAGVDMNQTMLALLAANPEAFIGNNINRLRKGAVLRIPTASEMVVTGIGDARSEVARQMDAWRASVGQALPQPEVTDTRSSSPTPRRPGDDSSRLELVPPRGEASGDSAQSGVSANSAGTELRRDLQRAREDLSARDQEISDLKSRVGELERIEGDSKRLIDMQNSELARLRDRLAELEAEKAAEASADTAAVNDETASLDAAADTAAADEAADAAAAAEGMADDIAATNADDGMDSTDEAAAGSTEEAQAMEEPVQTPPPPSSQPAAAPAQPAAASNPPPAAAMPWYRNLWVMVGGGALVLGLLLLGLLKLLRGGKTKAEPNRRVSESLAASAAPLAGDDDDGMSDREIELLEALSEQPEDLDRHLELVRYYYEQGNEDAFEGAAEAMYAQCADDPGNLAWRQVVAMGREVIPDHPMFDEAEPLPMPDADDAFERALEGEPPIAEAADNAAGDAPEDASFSWEEPSAEAPVHAEPAPREELDLGAISEPAPAAAESEPEAAGDLDEDAAATKLELARAYLDMGDIEGARGMLEEVLSEGNPGQRDEARRLLDEIR